MFVIGFAYICDLYLIFVCLRTLLYYVVTLWFILLPLSDYHYQYIKIFSCACVCDGCRRGRNEFAGRVQNYRVPCAK